MKSFYLAAGHLSAFFITCFRRGDNCVCCVCVCVLDFFRCRLVSRYISVDSRYWFNWHSTRTIWIFYGFCKSMCFWDECCLGLEESGCLFWYESVYYLILTSSECVFEKNSSDWWKYVVYAVISKFDFFFYVVLNFLWMEPKMEEKSVDCFLFFAFISMIQQCVNNAWIFIP